MSSNQVPDDVLVAIHKYSKDLWDGDADLIQYTVESEVAAYLALQQIDFGSATKVRQQITDCATEATESWEDRLNIVGYEISAFEELQQDFSDVPATIVRKLKADAAYEYPTDFSLQRDTVINGVNAYRHVEAVKAKIGPMSSLLIKMEQIIGNECYNGKIQNYGPGGVWEGEGRSFRYPVKFLDGDNIVKRWSVDDIPPEILITGHYQFGSNELSVFRALAKIVDMIEQDYGVRLTDIKPHS